MINEKSVTSLVTLANAAELAAAIAQEVVGGDISDTIEGNTLTQDALYALTMSAFQKKLKTYRGGI
jgi:hypothetical protein